MDICFYILANVSNAAVSMGCSYLFETLISIFLNI